MKDVFAAMAQAKQAIIFLVFQPGSPSIVEYAAACENAKPGLLIYGAATDPNANEDYKTLLIHRSAKNTAIVRDDIDVVSAKASTRSSPTGKKSCSSFPTRTQSSRQDTRDRPDVARLRRHHRQP